jgi:hypothetical protein
MPGTRRHSGSRKHRASVAEKISISIVGDSADRLQRLIDELTPNQDDPSIIYLKSKVSAANVVGQALAMFEWYHRVRKNGGKVFYSPTSKGDEMIEVQLFVN